MMKNFTIKTMLATVLTCSVILLKTQSSSAQVNTNLLTEVVKSCQQDALSLEYYERMHISWGRWLLSSYDGNKVESCINVRYFYSLVLSKLPSLTSTSEMLPGYPGSVAVSLLAFGSLDSWMNIVDCIASQDSSSPECLNYESTVVTVERLSPIYNDEEKIRNTGSNPTGVLPYIYICPTCVVAHDDVSSRKEMLNAFIKWFFGLNKLQRREVMSILGDEQDQTENRKSLLLEADRAVREYAEIRQRMQEQEKQQRRREVLGE